MLELFLGKQHMGAVTVCSKPRSCHYSVIAKFGNNLTHRHKTDVDLLTPLNILNFDL